MIIKNVELAHVCGVTSTLPKDTFPQIAFAGRSNSGKSSLINALINRKALARTSSAPGKTRTINYYAVNDEFYLVDLPGYGFAKVSQAEKEAWGKLIERYLNKTAEIKSVFLLVDIRHAPSVLDKQMYDWLLSKDKEAVIIAAKADKIKRAQTEKQLKLIRETLNAGKNATIIPFSAETKAGKDELWEIIENRL
ncbi:MAG: ribosome biogenesis GTP-binding protein YihA/YsxC [Lachnospiraceae bacterium]|jgi:GTP-binding protein|nr:ribosome biogenesis GTP-binding protein YihA/YsxC [Lachnospiraceae bacterium]